MKQYLFAFLLLFTALSFSQELNCCKTIDEVQELLKGDWKIEDSKSNIFYKVWFKKGRGGMEEMENSEEGYMIKSCQPFIEVLKAKEGFEILFVNLSGQYKVRIIELNKNSFVISDGDYQTNYVRVSE